MPELPDVEGYRIVLSEQLLGSQVRGVRTIDAGVLRNASAAAFEDRLVGACFQAIGRHGKWLMLQTDGPMLLIHNGMTGRPYFTEAGGLGHQETDRNDRLIINTDNGELRYADLRKLGGVWIVDNDAELTDILGVQGPDALALSAMDFRTALQARRGALKPTLMNQQVIAGLGNMLSDEICWRARLHPARAVNSLDDDELRDLYQAMRRTLRAAVRTRRIPRTRTWLSSARGRAAAACPRCRTMLRHTPIGGRTAIWCPSCQPVPNNQATERTDDGRPRHPVWQGPRRASPQTG